MEVAPVAKMLAAIALAGASAALPGCGRMQGQAEVKPPNAEARGRVFFRVVAPSAASRPLDGRLLIFLKKGSGNKEVDFDEFKPKGSWVAAREVRDLVPSSVIEVNADELAFPAPFSTVPAGDYEAQAVLDVDHSYAYRGRESGDWSSEVIPMSNWELGRGAEPVLTLDRQPGEDLKKDASLLMATAKAKIVGARREEFVSPALSRFWGRPVSVRAWVFVPPGYSRQARQTYPTAFWTHGFGGDLDSALGNGLRIYDRMKDGHLPPMIWVMLDESIPQGTHEFADSVNNGPWGTALTTEFLPYLEGKYRMDARPTGRLLTGHSSGGWATLQLQVNYPKIFGGTWSTSPDPADFQDFNGVDLYAPNANFYHRSDGSPVPLVRGEGNSPITMEEVAQAEAVLGAYGGQLTSFDWVFSPKGADGAPMPMFDRKSGAVDPMVATYWGEYYDLARIVERHWCERGADLKGRIHVTVGTADTFYLDGPARKFEAVLARLGAEAKFTYLPGRTHFNLYEADGDSLGLLNQIGEEMYSVARPGRAWRRR